MTTAMVALGDGISVEIDVSEEYVQQVGNTLFERVDKSIEQIGSISKKILMSFESDVLPETSKLTLQHLEVEFGLSFSGEGNVYITKLSGSANLKVKFTAKAK